MGLGWGKLTGRLRANLAKFENLGELEGNQASSCPEAVDKESLA